ncbi:MAG: YgiQ family radical SAM protein, partial [Candidatus Omnitrophota bacterium]
MNKNLFLPMSLEEMKARGWRELDVLIVSGDAYVDHPSYGTAVIGRILEDQGYKVGIIAQPDWHTGDDFKRLGRPRLCVCITSGNVDSMVAHYTANKRKRHDDDYTPGGVEGKRPDRALIVYSNRIREAFKGIPIVLGGMEASMRRLAHYDYWDNAPRRSVLLDAKANMIVYGMGERQIIEVVRRLDQGEEIGAISDIAGTVVNVKKENIPRDSLLIPSFEEVQKSHEAFNKAFAVIYQQMSPLKAKAIVQPHKDQYVLQNPPALPLTTKELDHSYALAYQRSWHPSYDVLGGVKGFETVRWSIIALRGCPGECSFCGLGMHQGRIVQSRSEGSILKEARLLASQSGFRGTITDIGGPTANLYLAKCARWEACDPCASKQCLMPSKCPSLKLAYDKTLALYRAIKNIPGVKHLFVESGIRYDLLIEEE